MNEEKKYVALYEKGRNYDAYGDNAQGRIYHKSHLCALRKYPF